METVKVETKKKSYSHLLNQVDIYKNSVTISVMKYNIFFNNSVEFSRALTALEVSADFFYEVTDETNCLMIATDDIQAIEVVFAENGIDESSFEVSKEKDVEHDQFISDSEADGDALRSAGFGPDEDYGSYGNDEEPGPYGDDE